MEVLGERIDRGDYELERVRQGEPRTGVHEYPDGSPRLETVRVSGAPNPDGTFDHKVAHMRPQDDPSVHALWQEQQWLFARIAELKKQQSGN